MATWRRITSRCQHFLSKKSFVRSGPAVSTFIAATGAFAAAIHCACPHDCRSARCSAFVAIDATGRMLCAARCLLLLRPSPEQCWLSQRPTMRANRGPGTDLRFAPVNLKLVEKTAGRGGPRHPNAFRTVISPRSKTALREDLTTPRSETGSSTDPMLHRRRRVDCAVPAVHEDNI